MKLFIIVSFVISFVYLIFANVFGLIENKDYTPLAFITMGLALGAEISRILSVKKRSSDDKVKDLSEEDMKAYEGIEFHNDFKKVPSGEGDVIKPKPINFTAPDIYHELNVALDEDMKKAGLETDKKKKD